MKTKEFFRHIILLCTLSFMALSCNSSSNNDDNLTSDSVRISSFALAADSTMIDNLNTVFFTIDLRNGLIYNADSLPKGTNVKALAINLTTESASKVMLTTDDSTFNYLDNEKVKINFTQPVKARVVSFSGLKEMEYEIKVNVHKIDPDRFAWGDMQFSSLPGETRPSASRTVKFNDAIYCYTSRDTQYEVAITTTPESAWNITTLNLAFTPEWKSLRTAANKLYVLDTEGNMHSSSDGIVWEATGERYAAIIGYLGNTLLTLSHDGEQYYHDQYPRPEGYTPTPIADNFPVKGFSDMLTYNSPWLTSPQGMIVGGRTASGELTGSMWGYDGSTWAVLNDQITPREGAMLFSYVTFFVDDNWITTEMPAWYVIGGVNDTKALNDAWVTNNYGITWNKANQEMLFPDYITPRGYGSIILNEEPMGSNLAGWLTMPATCEYRHMPLYTSVEEQLVPYVYLFGGYTKAGTQLNEVWRGVINRLTFEPIP